VQRRTGIFTEMRPKALLSVILVFAFLFALSANAQKQTVLKSNEHGEITLNQAVKAGAFTLQPDTYVVQHRTSDGQHLIRFMRVKKTQELRLSRAYTGWYTDTELIKAGEVQCRVEPLGAKAQASSLTVATKNGVPQITQVMVKGKAAVYVF
jgi:hypothetical protein